MNCFRHFCRNHRMGGWPIARPLDTHRTAQHRKSRIHNQSSDGIRTHNLSVRKPNKYAP